MRVHSTLVPGERTVTEKRGSTKGEHFHTKGSENRDAGISHSGGERNLGDG